MTYSIGMVTNKIIQTETGPAIASAGNIFFFFFGALFSSLIIMPPDPFS
jgi:hypothetical protein